MRGILIGIAVALLAMPLTAQWLHYPTPGIPRTKDGKPNLAAPTPRTSDGKPDLSGIWEVPTPKYLDNLGADGVEVPMQPWAAKLYQERQKNNGKDRPSGRCLPHSVTDFDALFTPRKVMQSPGVVTILFESYHSWRQLFTDGRPLPEIVEPAWFGYSAGKWEGDTLVMTTIGLKEQTWLDDGGHPHTEDLRITERFRRPDFGHMEVQVTIDDPRTYTKSWTVKIPWVYLADTELMDWVCENEKDSAHITAGK